MANPARSPRTIAAVSTAVETKNRSSRARLKSSRPAIAALPSSPTATVCTPATSVPNRELTTPVARNSWKVSAGMRNRSSRKGTAAFRLPNSEKNPLAASCG